MTNSKLYQAHKLATLGELTAKPIENNCMLSVVALCHIFFAFIVFLAELFNICHIETFYSLMLGLGFSSLLKAV